MHELMCPSCNSTSKFNLEDIMHLCPYCSGTFTVDLESGQKEIFSDHYIVPNLLDAQAVKEIFHEWIKRIHHTQSNVKHEFVVTSIKGTHTPFWVIPLEAHVSWKGLIRRQGRNLLKQTVGSDYLIESGEFRRNYRWAISARKNLCEVWGMIKLHRPLEPIKVDWDGFPLDSTFSRGSLNTPNEGGKDETIYEHREFFDFKYSNGLPILSVQVQDSEALRRAKNHVEVFHRSITQNNLDHLIDFRSEIEIAGVQLVHIPIWHCMYEYRPSGPLRHFLKPVVRNLLIDGHGKCVINAELALTHNEKAYVNSVVTGIAAAIFALLGLTLHPAMFLIALTALGISAGSLYVRSGRQASSDDAAIEAKNGARLHA